MTEYFILTIFVLIISLIKFKNTKIQLFLCFLPFFILIATRVGWTADYYTYERIFEEQHYWTWRDYLFFSFTKFEPGFFFLIKILPSHRALLVVISLFYTTAVFLLFYRYIPQKYYFLAFILWFYNSTFFESFAAVRSSIVLSFFIFAGICKLEGKTILSLLLVFVSGFFHMSGFLLLPLILIPKNFLKKHLSLASISFFSLLGIAVMFPQILDNFIINYLSDTSMNNYTNYIITAEFGLGYYLFTTFRFIFMIYFIYLVRKGTIDDNYLWLVFIILFYYVFISIPNIEIGYRIKSYLNPFIIALQCHVINKDKSLLSKIYISLTIIYMLYIFYYSFFEHPNFIPFFKDYKSSLFM